MECESEDDSATVDENERLLLEILIHIVSTEADRICASIKEGIPA